MLASRNPRMIYSHKDRLAAPQLPKYVPLTQVGGNFVLKFQIPVAVTVPDIQPTVAPLFSLHASSFRRFAVTVMAALSLNPLTGPHSFPLSPPHHISLLVPQPVPPVYPLHTPLSYVNPSVSSSRPSARPSQAASGTVGAAGLGAHTGNVASHTSAAALPVPVHGGAEDQGTVTTESGGAHNVLLGDDASACFPLDDDADITSHGGATDSQGDDVLDMSVAVASYGGADASGVQDSFLLRTGMFTLPQHYSPYSPSLLF